jgi:hypothetical protein
MALQNVLSTQGSELYKRMRVDEAPDNWRCTVYSYMTQLEGEATNAANYLRVRPFLDTGYMYSM